jgi:lysophospholipase L1-like esterase
MICMRRQAHSILLVLALLFTSTAHPAEQPPVFQENDIIAFIGGADVSAAQFAGHLETLLTVRHPTLRFRNLGWEGDTVYEQPRDFNFPPLTNHVQRCHATVLILQFGRAEALEGTKKLAAFKAAYRKLLADLRAITPRIILLTPPPFESAADPLPNLGARNDDLAAYSNSILEIGREENIPVIDLFSLLRNEKLKVPLTDDGLQLTILGQAAIARALATDLDLAKELESAGEPSASGAWANPRFEKLRQLIIAKNRLWFNYYRPQNWAFLGGDRTEQPSSRDYRDPKIRWFPTEIEKFNALITAKEQEITEQARRLQ